MFRVRAGLVSRRDSPLPEAISRVTPMTSLPSNPKDAAAPVAERRSAQRQTILTELLPKRFRNTNGMTPTSRCPASNTM